MIALDSNLFIYMLEANPEFGRLAEAVFLAVEGTSLDGSASELVFMEVLAYRSIDNRQQVNKLRVALEKLGIVFRPVTKLVLLEAARLRRECQLGAFDAIHVASALQSACTHFITNDQKLLQNKIKGIKLVPLAKAATLLT